MKRLLIDCSFISTTKLNTGIQRVVRKVLENITKSTQSFDYKPIEVRLQNGQIQQISLHSSTPPKNITPTKDDILLLLDSTWHLDTWQSIILAKQNGTKVVAVIYDIIPISHPQFCDTNLVQLFNQWFKEAAKYVDGFISISNTVQDQLYSFFQENYPQYVKYKFFSHFLLGADFSYQKFDFQTKDIQSTLTNLYQTHKNIYLIVCTIEPRKNHKYLLDVFDILWQKNIDVSLNIVGKVGWMVQDLIDRIHNHSQYNKKLFHFDDLNDYELNYCYKNSKILLFPSYIEGFGLPIIESLNNHLPVLASDIPIHKEVGKDKIGYFDISDPNDLANQIIQIETHSIPKNLIVSKDFKWLNWHQSTQMLVVQIQKFIDQYPLNHLLQNILKPTPTTQTTTSSSQKPPQTPPIDNDFIIKPLYTYEDFLPYHDITFITNIYKALLLRQPDQAGLAYYLDLLRSGKKTKIEIISMIRLSKEAREKDIKLLGFYKRAFMTILHSIPVISYISKTFKFLFSIPKYIQQLNHIQAINDYRYDNISALDQKINDIHHTLLSTITQQINTINKNFQNDYNQIDSHISQIASEFTIKLDKTKSIINQTQTQLLHIQKEIYSLEDTLEDKASIEDTTKLYQTLLQTKQSLQNDTHALEQLIHQAKLLIPPKFDSSAISQIASMQNNKFDDFYKSFEDKFRGTTADIKSQLKIYLPFIAQLPFKQISILDIGCGRGEWLELLKAHNYQAKGIDIDQNMIDYSTSLSLDVTLSDALSYLTDLPSDSLSCISGFHILEHLNSFDDILELLAQSYRVLKSGGIIIFETPNPRNILVGASDFYIDPSHKTPLHPLTLKFFAQKIGFSQAKSLIINQNRLIEIDEIEFNQLEDYIYIGKNYSLIGTKP